ncbi:MAG: hypothetical protein ABW150_09880 [Candidatus Thiodiazotropha sp.]
MHHNRQNPGDQKDPACGVGDYLQVFDLDPGRAGDASADGFEFIGQEGGEKRSVRNRPLARYLI